MTNKATKLIALIICLSAISLSACKKKEVDKPAIQTIISDSIPDTVTTTTKPPQTSTITTTKTPFVPTTPTERDSAYEKELVFIGDSICSGLRVYGNLLKSTQVFAEGNAGARSIFDYTFDINGQLLDAKQAVGNRQPKYIYLWMGMNDINITSEVDYAKNLKSIADELLKVSPYSKVIFVSITPTTATHPWKANDRINLFNDYTKKYVEDLKSTSIYYIDIHTILCDDEMALPDDYQSGDGLHLSPFAYELVLGYISANQIPYEGEFPITTTILTPIAPPVTTKPATTTAPITTETTTTITTTTTTIQSTTTTTTVSETTTPSQGTTTSVTTTPSETLSLENIS